MVLTKALPDQFVESESALRPLYPPPVDLVRRKQLGKLDDHCRRIISLSPLAMLATSDPEGACDVTPRGDSPGFVRVLDDRHIAIPDRNGNNRIDSMRNILANPKAGILFIVPGVDDLLRVNGRARIVTDNWLLASMAVGDRSPAAAILIEVEEAFLHCGRAFKRAHVWDPERFAKAGALPSLALMLADQTQPSRSERELLAGSENAPLY